MPSLEAMQQSFMAALDRGPDFLPDGLLGGPRQRAFRAMAVHANTISHARLVALEDTFPRTRAALGPARFNALSRDYLERPCAASVPLARVGRAFPAFIAEAGADEAVVLARFEWAWLESYHAADAAALTLDAVAALGETGLADLIVVRHPAVRLVATGGEVPAILSDEIPELAGARFILLTRPDAEVLVNAVDRTLARLLDRIGQPAALCNLLADPDEPGNEDAVLAAVIAAIGAGAVAATGGQ